MNENPLFSLLSSFLDVPKAFSSTLPSQLISKTASGLPRINPGPAMFSYQASNSRISQPSGNNHTGKKKVSDLAGLKTSLHVMTVTRSSVSLRLMMLCVHPGIM